jgi:hypothetical protein
MRDRIPPMTLNTLKEKNRELYKALTELAEDFKWNQNDKKGYD